MPSSLPRSAGERFQPSASGTPAFWLRAMCAFIFKTSFGSVFSKYTIVYHKTREKKMKTRRCTEIGGI